MHTQTPHLQDEMTVLVGLNGEGPPTQPLTDGAAPPRIEQLEARMIHAAQRRPAETFNLSLNPLVGAASGLLSEVVRLKHGAASENVQALNQRLGNDLDTFVTCAERAGVDNSLVMSARYVLCTVLDEAVVTTPWGKESQWSQMSLLSRFHRETFGGEKFFRVLTRLSKDPVKHLTMLELMYLCLALGFEGKYRVQVRGLLELEQLRDALYRLIRQQRGDVPRELSPRWQGLRAEPRAPVRIVPWWMVALFTGVSLGVMYSGFAWVLGQQREAVLQPYLALEPVVESSYSKEVK
ncbi:type VI secretion system protein ImpK [Pseudomonas sp. ok272]|uniref:type IVB secretion system protein IcmH/DotU n=1 Tax=unclassified Pseudomonas TaxID=196821 RepID=UPI0008C1CC05|nr:MULTISPECIES: type IVB secretion system protein IcmH/DotU [unclassified Pseudomonas]SEM60389.1 type VI secretion system protein ImpK [Pseudomonas sp. ok272]SFM49968.1 type VI secretion system protein ImpK [Pseudomonas sp. ok602]